MATTRQSRPERKPMTPQMRKRLTERKMQIEKKKNSIKWHWSLTVLIIGLIPAMIISIYFGIITCAPFSVLMYIILISGMGSLLIQLPFFRKNQKRFYGENQVIAIPFFIGYNFIGIGLICCTLFLLINFFGRDSEATIEYVEIIGVDSDYYTSEHTAVVFLLEGDRFKEYPEMRAFHPQKRHLYRQFGYNLVKYTYKTGLFGYIIPMEQETVKEKTE